MPPPANPPSPATPAPLRFWETEHFWNALPSLLWFGLGCVLLLLFRRDLHQLVNSLSWRVKSGATFKLAALEIGSAYVSPSGRPEGSGIVAVRKDEDGDFHGQRQQFRTELRNLFLVHRLAPAQDPAQLYDISIYLVPSLKHGTLASVLSVEYYFGRYWGSNIFRSIDRASGFLITTSACAVHLHGEGPFHGRKRCIPPPLHRL